MSKTKSMTTTNTNLDSLPYELLINICQYIGYEKAFREKIHNFTLKYVNRKLRKLFQKTNMIDIIGIPRFIEFEKRFPNIVIYNRKDNLLEKPRIYINVKNNKLIMIEPVIFGSIGYRKQKSTFGISYIEFTEGKLYKTRYIEYKTLIDIEKIELINNNHRELSKITHEISMVESEKLLLATASDKILSHFLEEQFREYINYIKLY